jgi:lipopolysaccharide export system ATP-binding protein
MARQHGRHAVRRERRRLEICEALATAPPFILLDEPFAGIDPIAVLDIQRIIAQLKSA